MKHFTKRLIVLMLLFCAFAYAQADKFEYNGLWFSTNNDGKTCAVSSNGNGVYSGNIVIPEVAIYNGKSYKVTSISDRAFYNCSGLTSVTIPNSVTWIGNTAFFGCSKLTSAPIPNSVTYIGYSAFNGCSGLTSVTIHNAVTYIGDFAFKDCSGVTTVIFNAEKCTEMGYRSVYVFSGCTKLTSLSIGDKVSIIPDYAFHSCSKLTSVTIPNSVTSIGDYAFKGCTALTEVDLNSVLNLGDKAFSGCTGLKSVSMLKAKSVNATAFEGCTTIETLMLPYEWSTDFKMDLSGTTQLRTLYIGENIASIPDNILVNNKLLFDVYSNATTPPSIGNATFGSETFTYATLYVPQGSVDAYKAATGWSRFDDIQEMPYQVVVKDKKVSVECNKTLTVSATVTPATATTAPIKWYSLDNTIATVTTDGVVTGMAEGGVTLLAYCDGITSTMKVIVKKFDGVEDVMADDPTELSEFDVYNLQGIRVRANCTKEQLSELSHGIYARP